MPREFRIPSQEEIVKRNGLIIDLPQALPTNNLCQVYPRVSTPEQKENVSAEMQQDRKFALRCGWPDNDDMIIVETDDLGLSGQLRMEDRPAFVKMLRNIANGKVKIVIVANISRFFRRKWNDEAEKFMQICDTYGVKIVVPNASRTAIKFVYDFSQRAHVEQFRRECEEAWNYLENHVYGTMHAAMDELGRAGFWTGGNLPIGYIVDRREKIDEKKNPNYLRFISYEPHAKAIRWLFARYWELGGRTLELLREIERKEYLFPAFSEEIDKEIVSRFVNPKVLDQDGKIKGYTIKTDKGLRNILTNVAYIGYWTYQGELTSTDNHDPIVDFSKFAYAFHRLSTIRLDGTQNEEVLERRKQYEKKHFADRPALLNGKLEASNPSQRIHVCTNLSESKEVRDGIGPKTINYYGFYRRRAGADKSVKYMISSPDLDSIFLKHFIERLQESKEFENFLDGEQAELTAKVQLQQDLERDIQAEQTILKRIEKQIESGEFADTPKLLKAAKESYKMHDAELTRLLERQKEVKKSTNVTQRRRSYTQLMRDVGAALNEGTLQEIIPSEEIPLFIDTFVNKVVQEQLSPHFYKMHIYWSEPEWDCDELVCYRDGNASARWSEKELLLLRVKYKTASKEDLLKSFPNRAYRSIAYQATQFGMHRPRHNPSRNSLPDTFCYRDWQVMQTYSVTEEFLRASKGGRLIWRA